MSGRRTSFGKLERERAKRAKAAAKRDVRHARSSGIEEPEEGVTPEEPVTTTSAARSEPSTAELLQMVEALHARFDAGVLPYEDFELQKSELMGRLQVE